MASSSVKDYKKRKEEEKARQSGQLAPQTDVASGKMINPHNPEYITKRPWYLGESGPSLNHHTKQKKDTLLAMADVDKILQDKKKTLGVATTYRKGACENCGSMTHKKVDCLERPRSLKKSAKVSGMDIKADEAVVNIEEFGKLSYDGKRDPWQGYRPEQFQRVVEMFEKKDEARRKRNQEKKEEHYRLKQEGKAKAKEESTKEKLRKKMSERAADGSSDSDVNDRTTDSASDTDSDSDSDYDSDEEEDDDDVKEFITKESEQRDFQGRFARQGGVGGAQMKETVRNLRIREDVPKYLYNLDPNSAYYDPKTRAMRDNPNPNVPVEEAAYAGDNAMRYTGDTVELAKMTLFAMENFGEEIPVDQKIIPEAGPTAALMVKRRYEDEVQQEKEEEKRKILEKYGGKEYLKSTDIRLRLGQTEAWTEYNREGRVVKGAMKAPARSKYEEDTYPGNHTSVWGSFFDRRSGKWGFKCCHSLTRNSYCMGQAGVEANDMANSKLDAAVVPSSTPMESSKLEKQPHVRRSELYGESEGAVDLDPEKLKEAIKKQKEFQKQKLEEDDRKRKYNSMQTSDVTREDLEAYRMTKPRWDDPMASFKEADK